MLEASEHAVIARADVSLGDDVQAPAAARALAVDLCCLKGFTGYVSVVSDEFRMEWRKTRNIQEKTKISQSVWLWAVVPQTAGMRPRRGRDGALSLRWHPRFRVWMK